MENNKDKFQHLHQNLVEINQIVLEMKYYFETCLAKKQKKLKNGLWKTGKSKMRSINV